MPQSRIALTDQQIAALAEGAALEGDATQAPTQPAAADVTGDSAPADVAPAAQADGAAPETQAAAPESAPAKPQADAVVAFLQAELSKAQAQIVELSVNLKTVTAKAEAATAAAAGFKAIAQTSVDRMKVALSMPSGIAASSDEALLAEHAELRSKFEASFKPGGVAAVSAAASQSTAGTTNADSVRQARIQATRLK